MPDRNQQTVEATRLLEGLIHNLGMDQKEVVAECNRLRLADGWPTMLSSSDLTRLASGEREANQRLLDDLGHVLSARTERTLGFAIAYGNPKVILRATDKGGGVPLHNGTRAKILQAFQNYLKGSLLNRREKVELPQGVFGVLVELGPMYCVLIDECQAGAAYEDVLAHELEALAPRLRGLPNGGAMVAELECLAAELRECRGPDPATRLAAKLIAIGKQLIRYGESASGPGPASELAY
jgi:hypothetical protein